MTGELMLSEMREQPDVLARVIARTGKIREQVRAIVPGRLDGIVLVGRGSSDNAAMLGRYACELAAHRPAGLAAPSLHTRYSSPVDYRGYLVIGLSQSGATPEVVSTCARMCESGAVVVAVTNDDSSALAGVSDLVISTQAGAELAVPATKTVVAEMALVLIIAGALDDGLDGASGLDRVPAAVEAVLADELPAFALAEAWSGYERLLVTARGLAYAAALETALKIKETGTRFRRGDVDRRSAAWPYRGDGGRSPGAQHRRRRADRRGRPRPRGTPGTDRGPDRHVLTGPGGDAPIASRPRRGCLHDRCHGAWTAALAGALACPRTRPRSPGGFEQGDGDGLIHDLDRGESRVESTEGIDVSQAQLPGNRHDMAH